MISAFSRYGARPSTIRDTMPSSMIRFWTNNTTQSEEPAGNMLLVMAFSFLVVFAGVSLRLSTSSKMIKSGRNCSRLIPRTAVSSPMAATLNPLSTRNWLRRQPFDVPCLVNAGP